MSRTRRDGAMTFGSLFSGIGGIDIGLEASGMKCAWQCEINPFCREVLKKHWPNVPKFNDVTKLCRRAYDCEPENDDGEVICPRCGIEFGECDCIGTDQFIDEYGVPDLIAGGFPCQDVSNAGHRDGIDGERSGLWREFIRIFCELRPNYILVENVGALSVRGLQQVMGDIHKSGLDAEWSIIPASAFGAPHRRERLFIFAYPSGDGLEGRITGEGKLQKPVSSLGDFDNWPALSEPIGCRKLNGIPNGMERLDALGNAVVPQVAQWIGERILDAVSNKGSTTCPARATH